MQGYISDIQHFSLNDGPGIRTTVFFKGCNMKCFWCHNPETQKCLPQLMFYSNLCIGCGKCVSVCPHSENGKTARFTDKCCMCGKCADFCYAGAIKIIGKAYDANSVMQNILRDKDIYLRSGGGVTFSGGEPLLQPEFLSELLDCCMESNIHTAIETAANVDYSVIDKIAEKTDMIICDIKTVDAEAHLKAIGVTNTQILHNIRNISVSGKQLLLRTPVIPGFNDSPDSIIAIAEFIHSLKHKHTLELLPFRGLCVGKYTALNRSYSAAGLKTPSKEHMAKLADIAIRNGVDCRVNYAQI